MESHLFFVHFSDDITFWCQIWDSTCHPDVKYLIQHKWNYSWTLSEPTIKQRCEIDAALNTCDDMDIISLSVVCQSRCLFVLFCDKYSFIIHVPHSFPPSFHFQCLFIYLGFSYAISYVFFFGAFSTIHRNSCICFQFQNGNENRKK